MTARKLFIFGAFGALGKGVTTSLLKKDFDEVTLYDFSEGEIQSEKKYSYIKVDDLSKEENVSAAFSSLKIEKDSHLFLYSTIGGYFGGKNFWETSFEEWNKMFTMNLSINFLILREFAKLVTQCRGGSACFTAAMTGLKATELHAAYGSSKAALIHFISSAALDGRKINLSMNGIAPYIIDTPANRSWMQNVNFDELIKPEEVGELIFSLFTNFRFVSGNVIELPHRFANI